MDSPVHTPGSKRSRKSDSPSDPPPVSQPAKAVKFHHEEDQADNEDSFELAQDILSSPETESHKVSKSDEALVSNEGSVNVLEGASNSGAKGSKMSLTEEDLRKIGKLFDERFNPVSERLNNLSTRTSRLEAKGREKNLIIFGVEENSGKSDTEAVNGVCLKLGITNVDIDDVFRLGNSSKPKPRPLMVKLVRMMDKKKMLTNAKNLKGSGIVLNDDLTENERDIRAELYKYFQQYKTTHPNATKSYRGLSMLVWDDKKFIGKFVIENGSVKQVITNNQE